MDDSRRDVKSRNNNLFHRLSRGLISMGLMPNHISLLSVLFAALGAYGFLLISQGSVLLGAIVTFVGIQFRLICNLIDGLMAVEGQLSSPQGELYNDVPDRFSDWFLILGTGFVIQSYPQGWNIAWAAATLAILTAYIRVLGASQDVGHDFGGPMAKQHRMAVLNLGVIGTLVEHVLFPGSLGMSLYVSVCVILVGSVITCGLRLFRISKKLS